MRNYKLYLIPILIILSTWYILSSLIFHPLILPFPHSVLLQMVQNFFIKTFYLDLAFTILRFLLGFIVGSVIGILIGLPIGASSRLSESFSPFIDFFRSIPATALIPIAILIVQKILKIPHDSFGITSSVLAAYVSFLLLIVQTTYGIKFSDSIRKVYYRQKMTKKLYYFFYVLFPDAVPQILSGFRQAASLSLIIVIVTEMFLGFEYGIGSTLMDSQALYETGITYSYIFFSGILGIGFNKILLWMEKRIIFWNRGQEQ